jgi:hypothetical protein
MKYNLFGTLAEIAGLVLVSVGAFQIYRPAGFIITGVLIVVAVEAGS